MIRYFDINKCLINTKSHTRSKSGFWKKHNFNNFYQFPSKLVPFNLIVHV